MISPTGTYFIVPNYQNKIYSSSQKITSSKATMQVMPQPIQTDKQLSHIFFTFTNLHFSHPRCIYINTLHLPTQDNVPNTSLKHTKTNLVKVLTSTSKFNTKKADENLRS